MPETHPGVTPGRGDVEQAERNRHNRQAIAEDIERPHGRQPESDWIVVVAMSESALPRVRADVEQDVTAAYWRMSGRGTLGAPIQLHRDHPSHIP
ncbi:hypothetical protein ACWIG2_08210 [Streptomyces cellulosae]